MLPTNQDEKIIHANPTRSAYAARKAAIDCAARSADAAENIPLFKDPAHLAKVETVKAIIKDFFPGTYELYVNHRTGSKSSGPFTTVKIMVTCFPSNVSKKRKQAQYDAPLDALGVERVNSVRTNSMLFRVR
jgi:hypothetical protein